MSSVESMVELIEEVREELEIEILTEMSILFEKHGLTRVVVADGLVACYSGSSDVEMPRDFDRLETLHAHHCEQDYVDWEATWTAENGWDN